MFHVKKEPLGELVGEYQCPNNWGRDLNLVLPVKIQVFLLLASKLKKKEKIFRKASDNRQ